MGFFSPLWIARGLCEAKREGEGKREWGMEGLGGWGEEREKVVMGSGGQRRVATQRFAA